MSQETSNTIFTKAEYLGAREREEIRRSSGDRGNHRPHPGWRAARDLRGFHDFVRGH